MFWGIKTAPIFDHEVKLEWLLKKLEMDACNAALKLSRIKHHKREKLPVGNVPYDALKRCLQNSLVMHFGNCFLTIHRAIYAQDKQTPASVSQPQNLKKRNLWQQGP